MSVFAAFLRGMNVGGHRLTNAELRSHFDAMGFSHVATFRASGNVVFAAASRKSEDVREQIEQGLQAALGYAVPTFIRSDAELRAIEQTNPFATKLVDASKGKLQVALLIAAPSAKAHREVLALASEQDRLDFAGRELFWLPQGGVLESSLDWKAIERLLGVSTMRTKNTLDLIAARHLPA